MKKDKAVQSNQSGTSRRYDVMWGVFLTGISVVFALVFLLNIVGVMKLYRSYVETEGQILAMQVVERVLPAGVTQQLYQCRISYDGYLTERAFCLPSVVTNADVRIVYNREKPLTVYCDVKKPSFIKTIRMYSKSYFWIMVGWLSPSFLALGLSVLYEEIYIKRSS